MRSAPARVFVHGLCLAAALGLVGRSAAQSDEHRIFSKGQRGFDERGGESLYRSICQGCHMADGRGATGAGTYPALAKNPKAASAEYLVLTVLNGRRNMPAFAQALDDAQVAEVVGYVRTHFGNAHATPFTAEQVSALRTPR